MTTLLVASVTVTGCDSQQGSNSSAESEIVANATMIDPHEAAATGNLPALKNNVNNNFKLDQENKFSRTVLMVAAKRGDAEMVNYLIAQGANTNTVSTRDQSTALILAAGGGHSKIVTVLLNAASDINAADSENTSALANAASNGHTNVVQQLIDNGASVNVLFQKFNTPLSAADRKGNFARVKMVI